MLISKVMKTIDRNKYDLVEEVTKHRQICFDQLEHTPNEAVEVNQELLSGLVNIKPDIIEKIALMDMTPAQFFITLSDFKDKLSYEFQISPSPDVRTKIIIYHEDRLSALGELLDNYNVAGTVDEYIRMLNLAKKVHNPAGNNYLLLLIESFMRNMQEA